MSSTLIVGIDVSSQSNSVFFMDSEGTCLLKKASLCLMTLLVLIL